MNQVFLKWYFPPEEYCKNKKARLAEDSFSNSIKNVGKCNILHTQLIDRVHLLGLGQLEASNFRNIGMCQHSRRYQMIHRTDRSE